MGNNNFCNCKTEPNNEAQDDIIYTDSTYNIWDNNPIRSLNSFSSQLTLSQYLNNKVQGISKESYQNPQSPRNGNQSTSIGIQDGGLTNSQINMKLEMLQEIMKKQNSIIREETEVDTIVELPNHSYRNVDKKSHQPSGFSNKKLQQDDNNSQIKFASQIYQSENQSMIEQNQSKLSQQFNQSQQGRIDTQATDQERIQTIPLYSLKNIKYENNYLEEERNFSQQFNDSNVDNSRIQNHSSKKLLQN